MRRMRPGLSTVETVVAAAVALFLVSAALVFVFGVTRHIARMHAEFLLAERMREARDRLLFRSVSREIEVPRNMLNEFYGGLASARSIGNESVGVVRYTPVGVYVDREDSERNGESRKMLREQTTLTNSFGDVRVAVRRVEGGSSCNTNLVLASVVGERCVGNLFDVRRCHCVLIPVFGTEQLPDLPADEPILPEKDPIPPGDRPDWLDWLSDEFEGGAS